CEVSYFFRPPRRAFGSIRSSNALAEKPPPSQKPSKLSPPPVQKPSKLSPPPLQKPVKISPLPLQKPSKLSPPNPVRATKPSRPVAKPLKKAAPGLDLEAKAKKRSQRVSFQDAAPVAPGCGEEAKASTVPDAAGHTPMAAVKAVEKPAKIMAAETPFFSAHNCSSCALDQLELATYWLAQIRMAEYVGKHWVAAAFFRLAFECQAQPIHRIQSELRNYAVRHESAGTLTHLFDELLTAHGMPVSQPIFDTDGFEKVDTPLATNVVEKKLDTATLKVDECLECDCGDDLVDVGAVIVDKHGEDGIDQPSFERKLNESFEFDDCEAVIVDQPEEASVDLPKNVEMKVSCSSEIGRSICRSSTEKLSSIGSIAVMDSSSGQLSSDNPLDKLSPSMRSSSAKRLSSGSPFDKKSPLLLKRLTSSCHSCKKSASTRDLSSKRVPSGSRSDGEHNAIDGAADHQSRVTQDVGSECPTLVYQLELKGPVEDASNNEIH
ncbi:uncharacterized protein LOC133910506, partial [Phragmites australis]|uniref:uncharacterized protein LOC133910506 n=1 Tax=Phragmites australis TaxID=29695 RepID=UPI002D78236C